MPIPVFFRVIRLPVRFDACVWAQGILLAMAFLASFSFGERAEAITWVEHSPGCNNPLGRGGNCTFWDGFKPAKYDHQVSCLSPNLKLDDPRAICWWNRRIMGYHLFKNGEHPAATKCVAASPNNWCNSLASNRSPGEGWNARYYTHQGITYYYLWRRHQCPEGWSERAGGTCVPSSADGGPAVALNAGAPSCPADGQGLGAGNPVHVGTGNKYQREVDLEPTSASGLRFVRHYNARRIDPSREAWRHSYQRELILKPLAYRQGEDGLLHGIHGTIQLRRADGRTILFYRTGEHELAASEEEIPTGIPAVGTNQYPLRWTGSEWRYRNESGALEYYDEAGQLKRIVDRQGFTQRVEHDAEGRVIEVRDDHGHTLTLEYERYQQQPSYLQAPAGRVWRYGYDGAGNLTTVTHPDGSVRTYHYGESDAPSDYLTGITDENGNRFATWQYDDQGRAILSEHAGGAERTEIEYLADGRVRVTDANGGERTYTTETIRGRMLPGAIADGCSACGTTAEWDYNDLGLPTRTVDRNGNVTIYQYNAHGLETSRTEAVGTSAERTITTDWDTELRLPLEVNEPGLRTQYTYDNRGRQLSKTETDPATGRSRTTTRSYHPDSGGVPGQLAEVDGPRTDVDDVTQYDYDTEGNRIRVTNALGHVTEITAHDESGRPLELVDPNGLVTELGYDARGRLRSRTVGGEVTTFGYDATGNLTAISLPDGSALHYDYDAAQRLIAIADEDGHRIDYTLDAAGNRIEQDVHDESGTLVRTQQQVFDELGRLIRTVGAQGQTTEHGYDDNGNRISTTDPVGDATQRAFDALDRLTQVTDPLGGITTYAYDANDRITAVTDPNGNTTRYAYNGFGDRTETDSPDSGVTTYQHDAAGNVLTKVDAKGQTTQYTYDALNRLIRTEYHDGMVVTYTWDENPNGIGRLSRIDETDPDGATHATEWAYDLHGRVVERSQTVDDLVLHTQHAYDEAGRRIETVYPSGRTVTYTYDTNKLTGIAIDGNPVLTDATYQPFGPIASWTWGDGDRHTREYDLDGRLTAHGLAMGGPAGGTRRLDYTADNNIATITGPVLARSYAYDGLDRLTAANDPDRIDSYVYDPNGNRTSRTEGTETETYTLETGSNRLLAISGAREVDYSYDANGNLINDGTHSYTYSARNRLIQVDDGGTAVYRYNALGQRIHKQAGGGSLDLPAAAQNGLTRAAVRYTKAQERRRQGQERRPDNGRGRSQDAGQQADPAPFAGGEEYFVYGDRGQLLGRYDESGNAIREYIYVGNLPVAVVAGDGIAYYIHSDQLGTPRMVSEPGGDIVWTWISAAFGDSAPNKDPDGDGNSFTLNLRYVGQYYDSETGTHYNWHRYYDPRNGRYITSDPIGIDGGLNTYLYTRANPISFVDPKGLVEWEANYSGGGLFIGVGAGVHNFQLVSECINGKQAEATVLLVGSGFGASAGYTVIPASIEEDLIFTDPYSTPDPNIFDGMGGMAAFGVQMAPWSWEVKGITLGDATYKSGTGDGVTGGIEVGGFSMSGSSTVISSNVKSCDCDK